MVRFLPCMMLVVRDAEPRDPGDDVVVDRQDHLAVDVDKSNLGSQMILMFVVLATRSTRWVCPHL